MEVYNYASLSSHGWISKGQLLDDLWFSNFFLSDKSQSNTYSGVISFAGILHETNNDMQATITQLEYHLKKYFGDLYQYVDCEVSEYPTESSAATIQIFLSFGDDTTAMKNLQKLIEIEGSSVKRIVDYNNQGIIS